MSRHEIKIENATLAVGFDRPMRTYFAQVHLDWLPLSTETQNAIYEATKEDESRDSYGKAIEEAEYQQNKNDLILWLGGNFDEYQDFDVFVKTLAENGYQLSDELKETLRLDQINQR